MKNRKMMSLQHNEITLFDDYGIIYVQNTPFYFDLDDLDVVESRVWYKDKDGYLTHSYFYAGKLCFVRFHRLIVEVKKNEFVDHINKNRADNRKANLRACGRSENMRNRGLLSTNKSGVTGVYYDKQRNKWTASITYNCKKLFIGRFELKEDAIRARLIKEVELFKEFAPQKALLEVYCEV